MEKLENISTEDLWQELADRHRDGECIHGTMPDYIDNIAQDHYQEYFESKIEDFTDTEIIDEIDAREIEIGYIYPDVLDALTGYFNCSGIAQIEFIKERIQEIENSIANYSYLKTA